MFFTLLPQYCFYYLQGAIVPILVCWVRHCLNLFVIQDYYLSGPQETISLALHLNALSPAEAVLRSSFHHDHTKDLYPLFIVPILVCWVRHCLNLFVYKTII
jgi:hypothetical protein